MSIAAYLSNILSTSGIVKPSALGTGSPSVSNYLRGDGAWQTPLTQGTSVASTSGTSIDFTGIPSTAKRITVIFNGVSVSGTSAIIVQLGSTTFTTTGYSGAASNFASATVATVNYTAGLPLMSSTSATAVWFGNTTICNISGNNWVSSTVLGRSDTTVSSSASGYIALGGVLDRVRITTVGGTDTFDAGTINIMYE